MRVPTRLPGCVWNLRVILALLRAARSVVGCDLPPVPRASARAVFELDGAKSFLQFESTAFLHDVSGKGSKIQGTIRLVDHERLTDPRFLLRTVEGQVLVRFDVTGTCTP